MHDFSGDKSELARWIFSLPCHVKIPPGCRDSFEKRGMVPTSVPEVRRFPRFNCRSVEQRAALEYRPTFPALPREKTWIAVYLTDVSRGGCRFLHAEPLYPGERLGLVLMTGLDQTIEVTWCRRVDEQFFDVGAQFANPLEQGTAALKNSADG